MEDKVIKFCKQCNEDTERIKHTVGKYIKYPCRVCISKSKKKYRSKLALDPERIAIDKKKKSDWDKKNHEKKRELFNSRAREYYKNNKDKSYNSWLIRKYNISLIDKNKIFVNQGSKCAICKREDANIKVNKFYIDHDHTTGKVRGVLCHHCNSAIGYFKDNIELLLLAIEYLKGSNDYALLN